MKTSLTKISRLVNGELFGDGEIEISGVSSIKDAKAGEITFVSSRKNMNAVSTSCATAFILPEKANIQKPYILVKNPYLSFAKLLTLFFPEQSYDGGVDKSAYIDETAFLASDVSILANACISKNVKIGKGTVVYPGVFIGAGSTVGENCRIFSNVTIYDLVNVGNNVRIHAGAVIGSDGFGYTKDEKGSYFKIPQVGKVIIENNVEIGANVCIDRATLGATVIREGVKLDNLVQVAHNVNVGKNTVIASQTGVSGSCDIGSNVIMAGQVGVADHTKIADHSILVAQAGVARDIVTPGAYSGTPAIEHNTWKRMQVSLPRLPKLLKRVKLLEKKIEELERKDKINC